MCGFTGYFDFSTWGSSESASKTLRQMSDEIVARGPDDFGIWYDCDAGIGLAHRRLAILDLSPAGHQPMTSHTGRYVIAFNGEIYNHLDLRKQLEKVGSAPLWRGHSDTESLLAGFATWGIQATVDRCIGMFAFAVWDRECRVLTLGRDALGEKPLYYGWQGTGERACFLFGSDLKALKLHPSFSAEIDRGSLCLLMRHNYIPAPYSIYQGIHKLQPGCLLSVSRESPAPEVRAWWSATEAASRGIIQPFVGSPSEAVNTLKGLLRDAVSKQMMADVPLGAFLSGGIDSSTVVALMQSQSPRAVRTFSIGFHEKGYNEAEYANSIAKHLGTDHTELYITPDQALAVIPKLPSLYSEPFADSSQIPTFLVSQLARQHVTVSLSGDGGDELFCGYTRYQMTAGLWDKVSCVPRLLRRLTAMMITAVPPRAWDKLGSILPMSHVGDRLHKGAMLLGSTSVDDLYRGMVSHWRDPANVVLMGSEPSTALTRACSELKDLDNVERMMALDMLSYLPDDILTKVDRAAMGVSLETRVPFLDRRVVEFAWSLPLNYKLHHGVSKWPLRQVLYEYVPRKLIERPKMGFGVPIDKWLRGPLRDWAESLLNESRLRQEGFFNPQPIRQKWSEHLSGQRNWQYHLWDVLMFQAWLETEGK